MDSRCSKWHSAIDQEDDIPTQENQIKQWVDNPCIVNSRLFFALRVECLVELKHIRDTFVPWMLKNDSHIKLDTLAAREIYGLGFIADVHPRLYNRAQMKNFLHQQLKKLNHDIELNVYSRRVWGTKNKQRLACHATSHQAAWSQVPERRLQWNGFAPATCGLDSCPMRRQQGRALSLLRGHPACPLFWFWPLVSR